MIDGIGYDDGWTAHECLERTTIDWQRELHDDRSVVSISNKIKAAYPHRSHRYLVAP